MPPQQTQKTDPVTSAINDPDYYSLGDQDQHSVLMNDPDYAKMSPDEQSQMRDEIRSQHGVYAMPGSAQASTPAESHWYDPVVSAYKWATSPFSAVQQTVGTPQQEQQKIQHMTDTDALKTPPDKFSRTKEEAKAFAAGMAGDTARDLGNPAAVATAATGALGEVPGIIGNIFKWGTRAGGAALVAKGAYDTAKAAPQAAKQIKQGAYLPATATMSGPLAEVAGGASMAIPGPHAKTPTQAQIDSLDHDMATGAQTYLKKFATGEKNAAGADLAALDQTVDAQNPEGVVDGRGILDKYEPQRKAMFPSGSAGEPTGPVNRLDRAAGTAPDVQDIQSQVAAQSQPHEVSTGLLDEHGQPITRTQPGNISPQVQSQLQTELASGQPLSHELLDELRNQGVEIPDEPRPWTMAESRQIQNSVMGLAKRMARTNPKGARLLTLIGKEIANQRFEAADGAALGDEFLKRNARYEHYKQTFEDGPLSRSLRGKNANEVLDPITGPNREVIRRQLADYGDQVDHKALAKAAQTHAIARKLAAAPPDLKNRILAAGGMIALGNAIGHPFLGLIGASSVGREAMMGALERKGFINDAGNTGIDITPGTHSLPLNKPPSFLYRAAINGAKGAAGAAGAAQGENQPYPLAPTHVHPGTGQRIAWDSRRQAYIDVDTGKPLVTAQQ